MMTELERKVLAETEKIVDSETGLSLGKAKIIREVKETKPGIIKIDFISPSPLSTLTINLAIALKNRAENIEGVEKVTVFCRGHVMEKEINNIVNKPRK
jgi:metal-sulfur cluster biosynthetic enzyme